METRRYYNRYQRPMPSATPARQINVPEEYDRRCITPTSLAMIYAPVQKFEEIYDTACALKNGTIFKHLNLQFTGKRY